MKLSFIVRYEIQAEAINNTLLTFHLIIIILINVIGKVNMRSQCIDALADVCRIPTKAQ